jgi:D-alanyl-D-alanine carboxypeptidase
VRTSDGRRRFAHGGGVPGFVSYLIYYPESQVTVAVLSNLPSGEASGPGQAPVTIVADWLGTLAHGGAVTLPAKR